MEKAIEIIESILISEEKVDNLSKLQKWICKIFKIVPDIKYNYTYRVLLNTAELYPGFVICDIQDNKWLVQLKETSRYSDMRNYIIKTDNVEKINNIGNLMTLIYTVHKD